ncbi:ATP-grasp domain-containing protein [Defluviimonas salinarum]|uniref:ATP-grasp domain-containing protein n=1 Tax=Defluviimonas salinarum TaxID=2992147 RepID=A0ABT3J893_9RHOB|nr:ATP-grasp domain-containing protein [Defluviimonas salinarum]MCW3783907.1 ATP-grasp domain-containing protein [Defluviimonas salinarum]
MKVWYTKGLSNTAHAMRLIRQDPLGGAIRLLGSHVDPANAVSAAADEFILEPVSVSDAAYAEWCLQTAIEREIDLVIPQRRPGALWAIRDRFFEAGIALHAAAAPEVLRILDRKDLFGIEMEKIGVPSPDFETFRTLVEFDEAVERMRSEGRAPDGLCVKPAVGIFGSGFRILKDEVCDMDRMMVLDNLEISFGLYRAVLAASRQDRDMMLMRYLPGPERSVDFLACNGTLVAAVARVKEGATQRLETEGASIEIARILAHHFGLSGQCNLQTREADGEEIILEINPRMSGGMQMSCLSGVNLPLWDVLTALGLRDASEIPLPRPGSRVRMREEPAIVTD